MYFLLQVMLTASNRIVLIILVLLIAFLLVCLLGGFSKVYVSMCDFYGQPHLEEVVWVCTLLVITEVSNQNCVCSEGHLRDGLFVVQMFFVLYRRVVY